MHSSLGDIVRRGVPPVFWEKSAQATESKENGMNAREERVRRRLKTKDGTFWRERRRGRVRGECSNADRPYMAQCRTISTYCQVV